MKTLLWTAGLRYLRRHPAQGLLAVLGISLGVAVVVAVDLAVGSAEQAFLLSAQAVTGRATHQITGGPRGVDEALYPRLRMEMGMRGSAPVIDAFARLPDFDGMAVRLLGVDPVADAAIHGLGIGEVDEGAVRRLLAEPNTVLISARTADHLQRHPGDVLRVLAAGHIHTLTIVGTMKAAQNIAARGLDEVLITDIATAQELLNRPGRLSRIDLRLPAGAAGQAAESRVRRMLPPDAVLLPASAATASLAQMTKAFTLNLRAMSLLALVVGMFLIYNATSFSVVQRRPLWAVLRAIGVTRAGIFRAVMAETVLLGAIGAVLGTGLGYVLGTGLVHIVVRTINDLYFTLTVSDPPLPPLVWIKGGVLGLLTSVSAAALPALKAAGHSVPEALRRGALETRLRRSLPWLALCGALLLSAGAAWSRLSGANLDQAFAGMFLVMAGYALLIPCATRVLMALLRRIAGWFGLIGRMTTRGVAVNLSRTGTAVAALTVAVSVTLGMAVMIDSFRHTLAAWLEHTLTADIYISVAGPSGTPLDPQLAAAVRALPEVAAVSTGRRLFLNGARDITELFVLDPAPASLKGFQFKHGDPAILWPAFLQQGAVLVSEPYATRRALAVGDKVTLRTEHGPHAFPIAGIYYDYGSDRGVVAMSRAAYERWWSDSAVTSLGLYLKAGEDSARMADALRRQLSRRQALLIRPNRVLRDDAFAVFDRTFTVTRVLQILALLVAAIGIVGALAALQLERGRELGVLRSLGFTRRQVWGMVTGECILMGLAAGLFALPLGLGLAIILIDVIQPHAFGWTMEMRIAPAQLARSMVLSLLAAAAAGIYPAWRMARTTPLAVLREE